MTKHEIEELKATLNKKYRDSGIICPSVSKSDLISKEDKITFAKINIMEMMLSNLAYGGDYFEMCERSWYKNNLYNNEYDWDILERLGVPNGKAECRRLWDEMKEDFHKYATIRRNVFEDGEGLTYNSVEWSERK